MKIITKELDLLLKREGKKIQEDIANETSSKLYAVAHLFHPCSNIDWYLIGYSMKDNYDYIFALTKGDYIEYGDVYLPELLELKVMCLGIERDLYFSPIEAEELRRNLEKERF